MTSTSTELVDVDVIWVRLRGGPDGLLQSNRVVLFESSGARRPLLAAAGLLHVREKYLPRLMLLRGGVLLRAELPVRPDEIMWHASVRVPGVSLAMFEVFASVVLRCLGDRIDCFQTALAIMSTLLVTPERFVFHDNSNGAPGGMTATSFATRFISVPKSFDPHSFFASKVRRVRKPEYALLIGQFFDSQRRSITVYYKMVGHVMTNAMLTDSVDSFLPWFALCEQAPALDKPISLYDFTMDYFREQGWVEVHGADEAADLFRTPKL